MALSIEETFFHHYRSPPWTSVVWLSGYVVWKFILIRPNCEMYKVVHVIGHDDQILWIKYPTGHVLEILNAQRVNMMEHNLTCYWTSFEGELVTVVTKYEVST